MVNFRHTDNVPSRGWEAKSAKGRTFSIPPESIGEVRGANFKDTKTQKKPPSVILGGVQIQVPRSISGQTAFYPGAGFTKRRLPLASASVLARSDPPLLSKSDP